MKRFQAFGTGLALAGIFALAGCGDGDAEAGSEPETGEAEPGGTAVVVEGADINTPSPLLFQTAMDGNLSMDVMNMELLRGDWDDGRLVYRTADENPTAMARRYELVGPDSAAVRFHMRSDLKWSDGQPITARDVVFTYQLAKDPALASPRIDYVENLDSVVAQNDSTVTFFFRTRYPEMLAHTGIAPVPEHVYREVDPAQFRAHASIRDPANGNLVVSGPWMIGEWQQGQRIVLVPNPHFQPRPNLNQLVYRVITEPTTRLVELQTGGADFVANVTFDQIPNLRAQAPDVRFESEEKRSYDYIAYNPQAHPALADSAVRRALGLAIDVPAMIQALQLGEFAEAAGAPYSPIFRELYDPELTPPLRHDPEQARQILEARGWRDTNGDGIRDRDGRPLRIVLESNSGNQRKADVMQLVQQQWRAIGVDAQIQLFEFNTFFERLRTQKYDAAVGTWQVGLTPDLSQLWGAESPYNVTRYQDPQTTALMSQALSQPTEAAAAPFWKQAAARIAQAQPYTFLYFYDTVHALSDRLRGVDIDTYGPYQNTWEWWIPRSMQRGQPTTPQ